MNKRQKAVQQAHLQNEESVLDELKRIYNQASEDITRKSQELSTQINDIQTLIDNTTDANELERLKSMQQSKIYQKQYQDALKKQVGGILDNMQVEEFKTVSDYLNKCYEEGFLGTLYDLQGQGVPMTFPIDQEAMVRAVQLDPKVSESLYTSIGENVDDLKKTIRSEIARGISNGSSYAQIAKQIQSRMVGTYEGKTGGALYRANLIARTEGHRIQCQGTMDACTEAKARGADVVKQWDATLDGKTRDSHSKVDGEIRELEEEFSNKLMFPGDPAGGAAEVCNCRCALLERARWAVKGGFTKMNNFTKQLETFESPEDYEEFKKSFFSKENKDFMNYQTDLEDKYGTKNFEKLLGNMTDDEYKKYMELYGKSPIYNKFVNKTDGVLTNSSKSNKIKSEISEKPILSSEQTIAKAKEIAEEIDNSTEIFTLTRIFEVVQNKTKNDGLPKVVSPEHFEKISKGKTKLYRGYHDDETGQKSVDDMINEFKYGKLYCGNSGGAAYGRGVYFTPDESIASGEYAYNGGKVITAVIDDSAKIADFNEITNEYLKTGIPQNFSGEKESYEYVLGDLGSYAAIKGYDGIALNGYQDKNHYIILNRSKLIIKE